MALLRRTLLLLATCIVAINCIENIDIEQPILRKAPAGLNSDGYFGYSAVFHQKVASPSGFDASLQNTYVIVGAPKGELANTQVDNPGFVYQCSLEQNQQCTRINAISDDSGDNSLEDKGGQFMGGALASNGDRFIACGHRYVNYNPSNTNTRNMYGRCFTSGRSLDNFEEFQPCTRVGRRQTSSVGACQAGMSAAVAETSDGNDHIAVGAPGTFTWRGILMRETPSTGNLELQQYDLTVDNLFGWQGYSVTKGYFRNTQTEDFATSVPRLGSYFGAVHIVENSNSLQMISQNLVGEQMGEYYGFALAALNMNGDGLHELLVSAPMYRDQTVGADTGRVFVYTNLGGTLSQHTTLVGMQAYGRFGHAIASLGDVSGDGFDDVAISAPFAGSGTVYIYHSSVTQVITPMPQQIIRPDRLKLFSSIISEFKSFGTSLASGVDVDGNGFNDLAVGSYVDQKVVILRTRPLALVTTTFTSNLGIVDLMSGAKAMYDGDNQMYTIFRVTLCVTLGGAGLGNNLNLNLELTAERDRLNQLLQQRLFFNDANNLNKPSTISRNISAVLDQEQCFNFDVFIENNIQDILNGFVIDLEVTTGVFDLMAADGNVDPIDLSAHPVVNIVGPNSVQVEIETDCDDPCIADLAITTNGAITYMTPTSSADVLTVGLVNEVRIPLRIENNGNNAYLARLTFTLPIQQLQFLGQSNPVITCNEGNGNGEELPYVCELGNPFQMDAMADTELRFAPTEFLTGAEGNIGLTFDVNSQNENTAAATMMDNTVTATLMVDTQANIFVDQGTTFPDQVDHAPSAPESVNSVVDLGPDFTTTFTVGNDGPSIIPTAQITIHWPLEVKGTNNRYFLYPIGWRAIQSSSLSVSCDPTYFNPANFDVAIDEEIDENMGSPGSEGKRRRRSISGKKPRRGRRNILLPRQDMTNIPVSVERTVNCMEEDQTNPNPNKNHTCVAIVCTVNQLSAGNRVQIEITAHTDERYLGGDIDRYTFRSEAVVTIDGSDHINDGNANDNVASAEFRSTPAIVVITTEGSQGDDESVPWYAIAIPIIVAVLLIITVAVVLYFCGFFRRKNKSEIEDLARENLAETDGGTAM